MYSFCVSCAFFFGLCPYAYMGKREGGRFVFSIAIDLEFFTAGGRRAGTVHEVCFLAWWSFWVWVVVCLVFSFLQRFEL
jgi:hypothetical protein